MICNASLAFITYWTDGEVRGSVNEAYVCSAASPGSLGAHADQSLSGIGTGFIRVTLRNHRQIVSHHRDDVMPLFVEPALRDRLGIDIE
jgi:hypothetical protein